MKKSELEALKWRRENIQLLRSRIAELEDSIQTARIAKISDMPKGTITGDLWDEVLDLKDELKAEYVRELKALLLLTDRCDAWLRTLDDRSRALIRLRFYEDKTWIEIAEHYNVETVSVWRWFKQIKFEK